MTKTRADLTATFQSLMDAPDLVVRIQREAYTREEQERHVHGDASCDDDTCWHPNNRR